MELKADYSGSDGAAAGAGLRRRASGQINDALAGRDDGGNRAAGPGGKGKSNSRSVLVGQRP